VVEGPKVAAIIRNETFSADQLEAIKRFINIHVVEPLNNGSNVPNLDFKKELDKIKQGDRSMTEYPIRVKLKNTLRTIKRRLATAIRDPQMIIYYFSRRY